MHRTVRRISVAGQRLGTADAIGKVHFNLNPLAEICICQQIGIRIAPDIRRAGHSVGVDSYPLVVGDAAHITVRILYAGCDGRQLQTHLCDAAEGRGTRRRIVHRRDVNRHGVLSCAVLRPVVDLEHEARVGQAVRVVEWGVPQLAIGQLGLGYRLRQIIRGDFRFIEGQCARVGQPSDLYDRQREESAREVAEVCSREQVLSVLVNRHRVVRRCGGVSNLKYRGEPVNAQEVLSVVGFVVIEFLSFE